MKSNKPVKSNFRICNEELAKHSELMVHKILDGNNILERGKTLFQNRVSEQKDIIMQTDKKLKKLKKKSAKITDENYRNQLTTKILKMEDQLLSEKFRLSSIENNFNIICQSLSKLEKEKQELEERLNDLEISGIKNSPDYKKLAEQAEITDMAIKLIKSLPLS